MPYARNRFQTDCSSVPPRSDDVSIEAAIPPGLGSSGIGVHHDSRHSIPRRHHPSIHIKYGEALLPRYMAIPQAARGIALFVHGSGSSRHSTRNIFVAEQLQHGKLATLLFDLLTPQEEAIDDQTGELRFNIPFLAHRVLGVTRWLRSEKDTRKLPIGYFGASTGAAAALVAAAQCPADVAAVVSRAGRHLSGESLAMVKAPTLLIVGGADSQVIDLNEQAMMYLGCEKTLQIVPGAGHLFEEPGALERVSRLARQWFLRHFH